MLAVLRAWHLTPASSRWMQLCVGLKGQLMSLLSVPTHCTSSSKMGSVPCPKKERLVAIAPWSEKPSCLQTTVASGVPQKSSHTVPQVKFKQTSTRPSVRLLPPISLMSPLSHATTHKSSDQHCEVFAYNKIELLVYIKLLNTPTLAGDACIFGVEAVVAPDGVSRTVTQHGLIACAPDIVQIDVSSSLSKPGIAEGSCICRGEDFGVVYITQPSCPWCVYLLAME